MSQAYSAWLSSLANANRGGFALSPINRGLAYNYTLSFPYDFSADTFKGALRPAPVDDTTAAAATAVFSVTVGAYSGGVTPVTWSLSEAQVEALPADDDGDGVATLYFDFLHTPNGGTEYRLAGGYVEILGGITNDDA